MGMSPPAAGSPGKGWFAMDVTTRRLIFAFLVLLFIIGCWVLVIGHQFDLGALNLAKSETYDSVVLGAYVVTVVSVALIAFAVIGAWLDI